MKLDKKGVFFSFVTLILLTTTSTCADGWLFPPLTVSSAIGNDVSEVKVGTCAHGDSFAIWKENDFIRTSSALFGDSWSAPITLSLTQGTSPQIFVDPLGNATTIWIENEKVYTSFFAVERETWSTPEPISSTGANQPLLAGDLNGNIVAVWQRGDTIESSTLIKGGSWPLSPDVLSNSNSSSPSMWVSDNGCALVGWTELVSGISVVHVIQKKIGFSWNSKTAVSDPMHNTMCPAVSVGNQNQAVATWFTYDFDGTNYSNVCVEASTQDKAQQWSTPVNFSYLVHHNSENAITQSSPGLMDPQKLCIKTAVDNNGNIIVVWTMSNDGANISVQSKRKPASLDWETDTFLLWTPNPCIYSLDISSQSEGKVLITWMYCNDSDQLTIQSLLCSYNAGDYYRSNLPLSISNDNYYPDGSIAGGSGIFYATAAWIHNDGMTTSIQAIQGSKDLPIPPTQLHVQEIQTTHAIFTDTAYVLTWNASPTPTTIAYYVYRNGQLIFQDYNQTRMFVDHNRTPGEQVTYEVTTFTLGGLESTPASISY